MTKKLITIAFLLLFPFHAWAEKISFLIIDADSYLVNKAVKGLKLPDKIEINFYTYQEIQENKPAQNFISASEVIIVDVMMSELNEYLLGNVDISKKRIYALRGSRDDEGLKARGFIFQPHIQDYFSQLSVINIQNLIYRVASQEIDSSIKYQPVIQKPELGIYHTDAPQLYTDYDQYIKWYETRPNYSKGAPWIGVIIFSAALIEGQVDRIDHLIRRLEEEGLNVAAGFGNDLDVLTQIMMDKKQKARVDLILSFSLKFYSSLSENIQSALDKLNIPILSAINLYSISIDEWRQSPVGIPLMDVAWTMVNPEISGLIEPSVLTGKVKVFDLGSNKHVFVHGPINDNINFLVPRVKNWIKLQKKKNKDKKIAILYYNHDQGKQNIGASYLNVFRSLNNILQRMKDEEYSIDIDGDLEEKAIKELILNYGRNIGSWAPGELDKMLETGKIVQLPVETYQKWFNELPEEFRNNVIEQWGKVEDSFIMIKDKNFIIPAIFLGNVLIMPEPSRGWGDDAMKLYQSPILYPHHQYIAAYLWIKHEFQADAMIHLGTHATHEWLPGKQAGLSVSCPPEVLITDIPNIYPYNVDVVGEGIQAKRRGRGVIIDHLTPAVKAGGLYYEYNELHDLIHNHMRAAARGSETAELKLEEIKSKVQELGIDKDMEIKKWDKDTIYKIEHYLHELEGGFMPYGMHTFGRSPVGEALSDTVDAIMKRNKGIDEHEIWKALVQSGQIELDRLIKALNGGFIPSGEGNDPIRNPAAVPTGKNFYGFSPAQVPSQAAFELGKKAAQDIIDKSLKEKNQYPQKAAIVLWATETIRNEGINESTILYLMGLRPTWDKNNRVTGVEVIAGKELNRPRIDVLINPSGLYRDLFPNLILFMDKAVQKAAAVKDIENLISLHNEQIYENLINQGIAKDKAEMLSRVRIFTEQPGSYGTGVDQMASSSGFWNSDEEVVDVYENRVGYAFSQQQWGEPAKALFQENLKGVDVAIHSISSNIFGTMDNDDMFQYLGGLSLAVKKRSGQTPQTLITMQRIAGKAEVQDIKKTTGQELRIRYLNPKWIEGMKKENYAGAREMSNFVEYMWGWQVTVPESVDEARWKETYEVYVEDKYGLEMREFFNKQNPWAYQSIAARMLESVRKGYWKADEKIQKKLAVEYAMNVIEKGVACCDHTCNNPMLNQMTVNLISIPGLMSPDMVEKFKLAIKQAMKKNLDQQTKNRKELQDKLLQAAKDITKKTPDKNKTQVQNQSPDGQKDDTIEGYKVEEIKNEDKSTSVPSSGIQWYASLLVILIIVLLAYGAKRKRK